MSSKTPFNVLNLFPYALLICDANVFNQVLDQLVLEQISMQVQFQFPEQVFPSPGLLYRSACLQNVHQATTRYSPLVYPLANKENIATSSSAAEKGCLKRCNKVTQFLANFEST